MLKDSGLSGSLTSDGAIKISDSGSQHLNKSDGGRVMNSKKNLLASTIAFFVGVGGVQGLAAEEGSKLASQHGIDEIIVTAQKREQRLIDVPISIEALGEEKIKDFGLTGLGDLARVVPNVYIRSLSDSNQSIVPRWQRALMTTEHLATVLDGNALASEAVLQGHQDCHQRAQDGAEIPTAAVINGDWAASTMFRLGAGFATSHSRCFCPCRQLSSSSG